MNATAIPSTSLITSPPKPRSSTPYISPLARTPYPAWTTSALLLAAVPATVKVPLGFPYLVQLPLFAAIFGGSGYMINAGDAVNGAGTTTAWALTFLFLHSKRALVSRRPAPILLTTAVAALGGVEGWDYFKND